MGKTKVDRLPGSPLSGPVGVAVASYNPEIMDSLVDGFMDELRAGLAPGNEPRILRVPGTLELAHALRLLASQPPKPAVLVALGCVIRGGTYHFEVVCNVSAHAFESVSTATGIPVINGVLTCEDRQQACERSKTKASEYANASLRMARLGVVT